MSPAAMSAQQQQAQPVPVSRFRELTRQQLAIIPALACNAFGTAFQALLPQTGYLARLWINLTATVTIPATPSGNWVTYPPLPFALIRRLRVFTSETVEIVNISGWGLALQNITYNRISDLMADPVAYLSATTRPLLYATQSGTLTAGNFTFAASFCVPIMTDDLMMLGMLDTQNNDVRVYLEITTANPADLVAPAATQPTVLAMTVTGDVEFFTIPPGSMDRPNQRFVCTLLEETFPYQNTGDVQWPAPLGNIYTQLIGMHEAPNAQVVPTTINNFSILYAQAVRPYYETMLGHALRNKWWYGLCLPDGCVNYDFTLGVGDPGNYDPRDFLNSSQQTDLKLVTNVSSVVAGQQLRVIKRQLAPIS
jgi:hypothetical protein